MVDKCDMTVVKLIRVENLKLIKKSGSGGYSENFAFGNIVSITGFSVFIRKSDHFRELYNVLGGE